MMCELFGTLIGVAVVVTLIAIVGHGFWLAGAAVLRALFSPPDTSADRLRAHCPHCGAKLKIVLERCQACGYRLGDPPQFTLESDLAAVERQLHRIGRSGELDPLRRSELLEIVRDQQARLLRGETLGPAEEAPARDVSPAGPPAPPFPTKSPTEVKETPAAPTAQFGNRLEPATEELTPGRKQAGISLLQAFMEQKNIRWGELMSGLLIVISSIGLVISLWATLKESIPYFPALLFLLVTAAIHGAGLYTLRRWKLESTSRGLLIISTLLIPLNFLAAIAVSEEHESNDPLYITAVTVGLLAFGAISSSAGRVLLPRRWWLLLIAVLGPSAGQLVIDRLAIPGLSTWWLTLLFAPVVLSYLIATGGQLWTAFRRRNLKESEAGQLFLLLGVSAFALLTPLGLLVWKTESIRTTLAALSPCLSLAAVVVIGLGLVVHRRVTDADLATTRMAGTWLALVGATLMLAAVVLAWPQAELLVAVGVADFVTLTVLAVAAELPILHTSGLAALALAYVVGFHLFRGHLSPGTATTGRQLVEVLLWGSSGAALAVLSIITATVAALLKRLGGRGWSDVGRETPEAAIRGFPLVVRSSPGHPAAYLWSTAGIGAVAIVVAVYSGFRPGVEPGLATPVLALYAMAALAAGPYIRLSRVTWFGSGLLLLTLAHGLVRNPELTRFLQESAMMPEHPFVVAALLHATLASVISLLTGRTVPRWRNEPELVQKFSTPLGYSALVSSALVLPTILMVEDAQFAAHCGYAFWAAGAWLVIALALDSQLLFTASQALATVAVGFVVTAFCRNQKWWANSYLDPRYLQFQLGTLAVWNVIWQATRMLGGSFPPLGKLMRTEWPAVDRIVLGGVVVGLFGLAASGCLPGIGAELATASSQTGGAAGLAYVFLLIFALTIGVLLAASLTSLHKHGAAYFFLGLAATWLIAVFAANSGIGRFWKLVGAPQEYAYGLGTWIVLGLTVAALVVSLWERFSATAVSGLVCATAAIPLLVAGPFEKELAAASALRWSLAVYAVIAAVLICCRASISAGAVRLGWPRRQDKSPHWLEPARVLVLAATMLPILALTLRFTVSALAGDMPRGPVAGSLFDRMGAAFSYAGPLCLLAVGLNLFAVRDRQPMFALAGSMLVQLAASLADILPRWIAGLRWGFPQLIELLWWNALALGGYSLVWLTCRRWIEPTSEEEEPTNWRSLSPFGVQITLTQVVVLLLSVWAAVVIVLSPGSLPAWVTRLGALKGQLALVLAGAASLWYYRRQLPESIVHVVVPVGMASTALLAASTASADIAGNWISYHALMAGWIAMAGLATAVACVSTFLMRTQFPSDQSDAQPGGTDARRVAGSDGHRPQGGREGPEVADLGHRFRSDPATHIRNLERLKLESVVGAAVRWATVIGGVVILLAFRGEWSDPARPVWSVVATALAAVFAAALAVRGRTQKFAYAATALAAWATTFACLRPWLDLGEQATRQSLVVLVEANVIAVALAGVVWLVVELLWQFRKGVVFDLRSVSPPVHHAAALVALAVAAVLAVECLWMRTLGDGLPPDVSNPGGWLMLSGLGVLLAGSLWDCSARHAVGGLYALGLVALTVLLDSLELSPRNLVFGAACAASGYVLLTGLIWSQRARIADWQERFKMPTSGLDADRTADWLTAANLVLAAAVVAVEFWVVLTFDSRAMRLYGAATAALLVPGIALWAHDRRRSLLKLLSLLVAAVAAIDFGWAIMNVTHERYFWLQRSIRVMEMLALTTFLYGVVGVRLVPRARSWFNSIRTAATVVGGASLVSLLGVLLLEAMWFNPDPAAQTLSEMGAITGLQIAVVAVVLVGLSVALISLAVLPGQDPLKLSERGRMAYVYVAEVVLSLLFLHIYLTMPQLFRGYLAPYWPFIVMAIAFCGIGVGELLSRLKLPVLSEPLERTGAFLPLLPALGFWIQVRGADVRGEYWALLFLVGLLYVMMSMWRKSFLYGLAAALAGNAGLWALWIDIGRSIFSRPQWWLIPPALSVLAAAQLNRKRLGEAQLTSIRYLAVTVIYVSSTGEMFLTGVANSLWLPMALALFSVAGVFAGILMRVRAFLYLGSSFLLLSMISMVWYAAQNIGHVWPWWAFGIALGLAILTIFGLFEKKRNEALQLLDELRQWDR